MGQNVHINSVAFPNSVKRQPFFGRCFVGNHIDICLKEDNIRKITESAHTTAVDANCITGVIEACKDVASKYTRVFNAMSKWHYVINSRRATSTAEIAQLDSDIANFLGIYREVFPRKRISPKLHILEDHVVPFVRKWGVFPGFYGEQGVEFVHAVFNRYYRTNAGLGEGVKRLKASMKLNQIECYPGVTEVLGVEE